MSDYSDKIKNRKRLESQPVVAVVNKLTPGGYEIKQPPGYDFYEGEAPLDWEAIQVTNPFRLIFQATVGRHGRHGNDKMDYAVQSYVDSCKARQLRYGLYHLLIPNSITEQMDFYCKSVDTLGGWGDMPPIVDIEYEPPSGRDTFRGSAWAYQIKTALDLLETRSGIRPLIYWSKKFASFTADKFGRPPSWINGYFHWIAGYLWTPFVDKYYFMPQTYVPNGVTNDMVAMWQYAEDGRYRGKPANDMNVFYRPYIDYLISKYGR